MRQVTRSRRQSRRSHTSSPIWPTRDIGAVPCLAGKIAGATVLGSRKNTTPVSPSTANSLNPHKPRAEHRGFVPRGLSYAKRRPKLFTEADWQRSGADAWLPATRHVNSRPTQGDRRGLHSDRRIGTALVTFLEREEPNCLNAQSPLQSIESIGRDDQLERRQIVVSLPISMRKDRSVRRDAAKSVPAVRGSNAGAAETTSDSSRLVSCVGFQRGVSLIAVPPAAARRRPL